MDFTTLKKQGKTVIYQETDSQEVFPGEGWEYWGSCKTPDTEVAVWCKIVTVEEAEQFYAEQEVAS